MVNKYKEGGELSSNIMPSIGQDEYFGMTEEVFKQVLRDAGIPVPSDYEGPGGMPLSVKYRHMDDPESMRGADYHAQSGHELGRITWSSPELGGYFHKVASEDDNYSDFLKLFYKEKGMPDNLLDSLVQETISDIPNTVFGIYGDEGGMEYNIHDKDKAASMLKGLFLPGHSEDVPDTVMAYGEQKQGDMIRTLMHEMLGHKLSSIARGNPELQQYGEHSQDDYHEDRHAYEILEKEPIKNMNIGTMNKFLELLGWYKFKDPNISMEEQYKLPDGTVPEWAKKWSSDEN